MGKVILYKIKLIRKRKKEINKGKEGGRERGTKEWEKQTGRCRGLRKKTAAIVTRVPRSWATLAKPVGRAGVHGDSGASYQKWDPSSFLGGLSSGSSAAPFRESSSCLLHAEVIPVAVNF